MRESSYSESSDAMRLVAEKDHGAIELHAQIELQAETEVHVGWDDRRPRMLS